MRFANALVLLGVILLLIGTARMTVCCVSVMSNSPYEAEQRQTLRKMCRDILAKLQAHYGDQSVAEWPNEESKLLYAAAEGYMAELEEN